MKPLSVLSIFFAAGTLAACSGPSQPLEPIEKALSDVEPVSTISAPVDPIEDRPGDDWPQWRGPRQDGISQESGLLSEWPESGPTQLWRVELGNGYSTVVVAGNRAYTMFGDDEGEYVVCIDASDGRIIWQVTSAGPFKNVYGGGPRATPTIHDGRVYTIGATGIALCLDAFSGEKVWGINVIEEFEGENLEWGLSASPVIFKDKLVLVVNGSDGKSLAALDKNTGATIWTSLDDKAGYSTPIVIELNNEMQLVVMTGVAVVGVALADGAERWRQEWITDLDANVASPIFHDGRLFVSSGYDTGSALFELAVIDGEIEPNLLWRTKKMKNLISSSILIDGFLYGFHNSILNCVDFETGKVQWSHRGFKRGSVFSADGKLVIYGERGTLAIAELSSEGYAELSSAKIFGGNKTWSIPTLSRGRLFVRNDEELICLDLMP